MCELVECGALSCVFIRLKQKRIEWTAKGSGGGESRSQWPGVRERGANYRATTCPGTLGPSSRLC